MQNEEKIEKETKERGKSKGGRLEREKSKKE
jgi:hypothetical protein